MKIFKLSATTLLFLLINSVNASTIIDSFNDSTPQIVSANGSDTVATSSAIGGYRTISISKSGPLGASASVISGIFAHSADALTSAISTITWDANGAGLNADLLASDTLGFTGSSCYECFVLDVLSIDQGNVDLTIQLSDGSNTASYTSSGVGTGLYEVMFSQFTGVDLTSIMAISLEINGAQASDMTLDFQGYTGKQVSSVPLPATVWLFATGLISFLGTHRRKIS